MRAARALGAIRTPSRTDFLAIYACADMNVHLCPAVPADASGIATVHIRSWQSAYRGQIPDDYLDRLGEELASRIEFWRTHVANPSPSVEIWVARVEEHIDGFVAFGPARDAIGNTGEIYAIYVHPDRWHQGVGRALFAQAAGRLSLKFSAATLWVLASNTRARRFYEFAGWSMDGRTKLEKPFGGIELKEVSYRREFRHDNQQSINEE